MGLEIGINGVNKEISKVEFGVNNIWKEVNKAEIGNKLVWSNQTYTLTQLSSHYIGFYVECIYGYNKSANVLTADRFTLDTITGNRINTANIGSRYLSYYNECNSYNEDAFYIQNNTLNKFKASDASLLYTKTFPNETDVRDTQYSRIDDRVYIRVVTSVNTLYKSVNTLYKLDKYGLIDNSVVINSSYSFLLAKDCVTGYAILCTNTLISLQVINLNTMSIVSSWGLGLPNSGEVLAAGLSDGSIVIFFNSSSDNYLKLWHLDSNGNAINSITVDNTVTNLIPMGCQVDDDDNIYLVGHVSGTYSNGYFYKFDSNLNQIFRYENLISDGDGSGAPPADNKLYCIYNNILYYLHGYNSNSALERYLMS